MLPGIKKEYSIDLVIANGEMPLGMDHRPVLSELKEMGIDVITGGNHIWDKRSLRFHRQRARLAEAANYPAARPAAGGQW